MLKRPASVNKNPSSSRSTNKALHTSSLDRSFYYVDTPTRPQHISAIAVFANPINYTQLNSRLFELLTTYPRLSSEFDGKNFISADQIENNLEIIKHELIDPDQSVNSKILELLINPIFHKKKSWIIHSLEIKSTSLTYLIFKLHHSLADGISGLGFFHNLLFIDNKQSKKNMNNQIPFTKSLYALFQESLLKQTNKKDSSSETRGRILIFISIPITKVRQLKLQFNTSSQALNLAIASILYSNIFESQKIFHVLVPVATSTSPRKGILGNFIGGTSLSINLSEDSVNVRLKNIEIQLKRKLTAKSFGAYSIFASFLNILPNKLASALATHAANKIDAIVTSLNGPKKQTLVFGNKTLENNMLHEYAVPALMPGQKVGFGFMKNKNNLDITLIADSSIGISEAELHNQSMEALKKFSLV